MDEESPENQWDRLQREYQKGIQAAYPNPERRGCLEGRCLQDLAARSARHEDIEGDEDWKHVIHCSPCYQEYLDFREAFRVGNAAKAHRESL